MRNFGCHRGAAEAGRPPLPPKTGRNRLHFELAPAGGDQEAEVDRLVALGATLDIEQREHGIGLTDPDGNEFCVLPPGA